MIPTIGEKIFNEYPGWRWNICGDGELREKFNKIFLVSDILINEYNCKLENKKQILNDNILVSPKEVLCNPSLKPRTIHAFSASWLDKKNMSLIGKLENNLRGKIFNKKIFFYRIFDYLIFMSQKAISLRLKK